MNLQTVFLNGVKNHYIEEFSKKGFFAITQRTNSTPLQRSQQITINI